MAQWWRAYNEALDDPKLQKLPAELFRAWFNLVCLASRNRGVLPSLEDIAFALRTTPQKADKIVIALIDAKLFDTTDEGLKPHNWSSRQYESDVSTTRVKRFRDKQRNVSGNAPDTDQIQTRPDTEDVDDSAPENVARETSHVAVGETVLDIMGVREDPRFAFSYAIVGGWLSAGYDPEADIYPTVRAVMAKRNGQGPPNHLKYFTEAIGQAHRDRTTPVSPDLGPIHAKQSSSNPRRGSIAAAQSLIAKMDDKGML